MEIQVGVGGANGRMGQLVIQALQDDPLTHCTAKIDRQTPLKSITAPLDLFIDFTNPETVLDHLKICLNRQLPMVIGVTGFTDLQKKEIENASKRIPIVFAPNMSMGINLCYKLLELAAATLKNHADIAIQEVHHKNKKDAPSGTALRMGEIVSSNNFASTRVGNIMGNHSVLFAMDGECIEITHRSQNRMIYARGAVIAAKWLIDKKPGLYDMQHVLNLH